MSRADLPAPFSILFEEPHLAAEPSEAAEPDFFHDLNLDQVFQAVVQKREEYKLDAFFRLPLRTASAVRYRQDVFRDLEAGLAPAVQEFASSLRRVRSHLTGAEQRHHAYGRAAYFLDAGHIYCEAVLALEAAIDGAEPASESFRRCRSYLQAYRTSEPFHALLQETIRLKKELADVRYCVRIRGSRVIVTPYQGEADYSSEVLEVFRKFQQGDVESRLVEYSPEFNNHVQERIVDLVARLYPDLFRSLLEYPKTFADLVAPDVGRFDREVQFYLGYLGLLMPLRAAGLPFCYPAVSSRTKDVAAAETFDLALALKLVAEEKRVVGNDFELSSGERILVVSGPNQGGKTTLARTFGQLHHLAALGCPVPGSSSRLYLCDRIFTHFERREQVEDLHSKLQDELLRVREILRRATPCSIVILNESLASTTVDDAVFLGREVIGKLVELDALAVYVTFIDELSRLGPSVVSMVSTVVPDNPAQRTFKVVRQVADGRAYAAAIAEKHGLTSRAIKERMRR